MAFSDSMERAPILSRLILTALILSCVISGNWNIARAADTPLAAPREATRPTTWTARILRTNWGPRIQALSFSNMEVPVSLRPGSGRLRPIVELHGHFNQPGWKLYAQGTPLIGKPPDTSEFTLFAYLKGRVNRIALTARGPAGEIQNEQILIYAPSAMEYRVGSSWGSLLVSFGVSSLSYFQTGFGDFSSKTGMVSLDYTGPRTSSRFGMSASLRVNLLTFTSSPIQSGPQIVEGKLDGTYALPKKPQSRLQTSLAAGITYFSMLSNGSPFGFSNLLAPELGTHLDYQLARGSKLIGDLRYAPLGAVLSVTQSGIDLLAGWQKTLSNSHPVQFDLGYTYYSYQPTAGNTVSTGLLSLRIGYGI